MDENILSKGEKMMLQQDLALVIFKVLDLPRGVYFAQYCPHNRGHSRLSNEDLGRPSGPRPTGLSNITLSNIRGPSSSEKVAWTRHLAVFTASTSTPYPSTHKFEI